MKPLQDLTDISRYYGNQKDYTLAGGGNTSWKDDKYIWVKASGISLASINKDGFVKLEREKVKITGTKNYSKDPHTREAQVKEDLIASIADPSTQKRPSVETSLHELLEYPFVVHLHPTLTNSLTCSMHAEEKTRELFGDEVMFTGYAAGYQLFKNVQNEIASYRNRFNKDPGIIFMKNHGVFVSANSTSEIKRLYKYITETIKRELHNSLKTKNLAVKDNIRSILPALRLLLSEDNIKLLKIRHNTLIQHFYSSEQNFNKVALPFTPDIIVYCKSRYLYLEDSSSPENIVKEAEDKIKALSSEIYAMYPSLLWVS